MLGWIKVNGKFANLQICKYIYYTHNIIQNAFFICKNFCKFAENSSPWVHLLQKFAKNLQKFAKICRNIHLGFTFCKNLQKFAEICRICKNLQKKFTLDSPFAKKIHFLQIFCKFFANFCKFCKFLQMIINHIKTVYLHSKMVFFFVL